MYPGIIILQCGLSIHVNAIVEMFNNRVSHDFNEII